MMIQRGLTEYCAGTEANEMDCSLRRWDDLDLDCWIAG